MALAKIIGAQRDFSAGELDVSMKRADDNPRMKTGTRQMVNWRILNSKSVQNRPGRAALFLETGRVEQILMSPGNNFYIVFGNGYLSVYNAAGARVFNSTKKGDGSTNIPWTTATVKNISYVIPSGSQKSIYICYGDDAPVNVPQILTWDGVSQASTWTLSTFAESVTAGNQKRTPFYRISPQNITMLPSATSGNINVTLSAAVFVSGMIGTRMRFCGRQILITAVTLSDFSTPTAGPSQYATATVEEPLPISQEINAGSPIVGIVNVGDLMTGTVSGAQGIITSVDYGSGTFILQLIQNDATTIRPFLGGSEWAVGPGGSVSISSQTVKSPTAVIIWDDEVMNSFRGWPTSVFYDQGRLGFCNFPSVPSAIAWSAIGLTKDLYVLPLPDNAIFELAPGKSQVYFVQAGMESSEFVFCDNAIYYIPISATNPLVPGSVAFNQLSANGSMPNVQPRRAEQTIVYMKAGGAQVGAVQAPGAYYRPYVVESISEFHGHLFTASPAIAIAVPTASTQFEELYAYILLANGNLVVGKYAMHQGLIEPGPDGKPAVGWSQWNGAAENAWVAAWQNQVTFAANYAPGGISAIGVVEMLDNTQYLDCAIPVAAVPTPFVTGGKGPLYFIAGGTVELMDQSTRMMGTYQVDANGNIVPQNNGGEDLTAATLVAGQTWTATLEPFVPDANPGQSVHQRMFKRRVSRMAVYVSNSTGFLLARLFSGPLTRTSPALGTIMNTRRVTTWNQDDDPTKAPPLREEAQRWRPIGRAYDPRVAVIKDTPGPIMVHEIGIEASI